MYSFDTVVACATAPGGYQAVLRVSGTDAIAVVHRAGLSLGTSWSCLEQSWRLGGGTCPCRVVLCQAPRSFTGCDLIEITVPGSADLIELALSTVQRAGASVALPGAFTRMAVATGRMRLDQAEAVLALAQAPTAIAAGQALQRLRGALSHRCANLRERLIAVRAQIEAGLDFIEEADVRSYDAAILQRELLHMRDTLQSFLVVADQYEGVPRICLVGCANAGKSALFNRLTGAQALVAPIAGTTRDWLEAGWFVGDREVQVIDTAGWLESAQGTSLDHQALAAGRERLAGAALIIACSAPDAPLPVDHGLEHERTIIIATKADLGVRDKRAVLAVSAETGAGLTALTGLVAERLGGIAAGEPRQQRLLAECVAVLTPLTVQLPADELLADDLRRCAELLGELIGVTAPDDVLDAIFSRFCIGK